MMNLTEQKAAQCRKLIGMYIDRIKNTKDILTRAKLESKLQTKQICATWYESGYEAQADQFNKTAQFIAPVIFI